MKTIEGTEAYNEATIREWMASAPHKRADGSSDRCGSGMFFSTETHYYPSDDLLMKVIRTTLHYATGDRADFSGETQERPPVAIIYSRATGLIQRSIMEE